LNPGELGLDHFGHVVEARVFGAAMLKAIPRLENLDFYCPVSVDAIEFGASAATIQCIGEQGQIRLSARLVVGADGANSFVREGLGIGVEQYDYGQSAVICNVTPEQNHRGRAFECFPQTGPFAILPHVQSRCGLVWCVPSDQVDVMMEMPEPEFLEQANQRFGRRLGAFLKMGRRTSYPLKLVRALEDVRPRAVILGNAAHAIHPNGAQGFNLGLRDAAVLAEVLANAAGADPGDIELLRKYSAWRAPDQQGTIAYSDGLARLFSNPSGLSASARTVGMLAHAFIPPLRRQLAIRAMGFRGRIPRLALGEPL
jgi:2-octaprenyl-6-methoxyphenol hydroxylase